MSVFQDILGRESGSERPAILGPESASFGELLRAAERAAKILREAGARPGDRLALGLPHGLAHMVTMFGARAAGLILVPINPAATSQEKAHILADSGARFLVQEAGTDLAQTGLRYRKAGDLTGAELVEMDPASCFEPEASDEWIIYTSGSTGKPKGVILSATAFAANVAGVCAVLELTPDDSSVVFTPPQYTLALNQIFTHLWSGGAVLPMPRGLLDPFGLLEAVGKERISGLHLNPGIMRMLLNTLNDDFPHLPDLRYLLLLGQPLTSGLVSAVLKKCPGIRIFNGYGCTENSPRIAMKILDGYKGDDDRSLPVGSAVPGTEFAILDERGECIGAGIRGEISIRGKSLMRGYLGAPEIMRERMANGWFRTRDLGFVDERGDLHIVGRVDNIMRVGHEKVSPEDVEEEILKVEGVCDTAVGGVPDELHFEVPAALIVHEGDFETVVNSVKSRVRRMLSRSRVPRHFYRVDKIPRTHYGKIDRSGVAAVLKDMHRNQI